MIMTKRQHQYAKEKGFKWIYVNHYNYVMASNEKPFIKTVDGFHGPILEWEPDGERIGGYQGDWWWTNTLEEII